MNGTRHLFLPAAALRGVVRYFHVEAGASGQVIVPASPYPMVNFFISGGSFVVNADGSRQVFDEPFLCGPMRSALAATWLPGTCFVSALFEPPRFGELFEVGLDALRDGPQPLSAIAPHLSWAALQERLWRASAPGQWVAMLGDWLWTLARRRETQLRGAFSLAPGLLFAPGAHIAGELGLSVRQLERKHLAAYGLSMRESRTMARYTAALSLLIRHGGGRGVLTGIAAAAGYHDQAHMIHDFRKILGIAPGRLLTAGDDSDPLRLFRYEGAQADIVTAV